MSNVLTETPVVVTRRIKNGQVQAICEPKFYLSVAFLAWEAGQNGTSFSTFQERLRELRGAGGVPVMGVDFEE